MTDSDAAAGTGGRNKAASEMSTDAAPTIREARRRLAERLQSAGSESPALDARILTEAALGERAPDLSAPLGDRAAATLVGFERRRVSGEPVWRILGEREFWGLPFRLSPATLEPRPDSETLIEAALECLGGRRSEQLSFLDLGTGTGCLLIAALHEFPVARGLGIDLSQEACETAAHNAGVNGVGDRAVFRQGNWTQEITERFDLILSNPPYIREADIAGLAPGVRNYDPMLALDGGADGLEPYRNFAVSLPPLLAPEGVIILEIGAGQEGDVAALMQQHGLRHCGTRKDLGGHGRALIFAGI